MKNPRLVEAAFENELGFWSVVVKGQYWAVLRCVANANASLSLQKAMLSS